MIRPVPADWRRTGIAGGTGIAAAPGADMGSHRLGSPRGASLTTRLSPRRWTAEWPLIAVACITAAAASTVATGPSADQARLARLMQQGLAATAAIDAVEVVPTFARPQRTGRAGRRSDPLPEFTLGLAWTDSEGRRLSVTGLRLTAQEVSRLGLFDARGARVRKALPIRYAPADGVALRAPDAGATPAEPAAAGGAPERPTDTGDERGLCTPAALCANLLVPELYADPLWEPRTFYVAAAVAAWSALLLTLLARAFGLIGRRRTA